MLYPYREDWICFRLKRHCILQQECAGYVGPAMVGSYTCRPPTLGVWEWTARVHASRCRPTNLICQTFPSGPRFSLEAKFRCIRRSEGSHITWAHPHPSPPAIVPSRKGILSFRTLPPFKQCHSSYYQFTLHVHIPLAVQPLFSQLAHARSKHFSDTVQGSITTFGKGRKFDSYTIGQTP